MSWPPRRSACWTSASWGAGGAPGEAGHVAAGAGWRQGGAVIWGTMDEFLFSLPHGSSPSLLSIPCQGVGGVSLGGAGWGGVLRAKTGKEGGVRAFIAKGCSFALLKSHPRSPECTQRTLSLCPMRSDSFIAAEAASDGLRCGRNPQSGQEGPRGEPCHHHRHLLWGGCFLALMIKARLEGKRNSHLRHHRAQERHPLLRWPLPGGVLLSLKINRLRPQQQQTKK